VALRELNQRTLSGSVFDERAVWMTPFSFLIEFVLKGLNDGRSAQMRQPSQFSGLLACRGSPRPTKNRTPAHAGGRMTRLPGSCTGSATVSANECSAGHPLRRSLSSDEQTPAALET